MNKINIDIKRLSKALDLSVEDDLDVMEILESLNIDFIEISFESLGILIERVLTEHGVELEHSFEEFKKYDDELKLSQGIIPEGYRELDDVDVRKLTDNDFDEDDRYYLNYDGKLYDITGIDLFDPPEDLDIETKEAIDSVFREFLAMMPSNSENN